MRRGPVLAGALGSSLCFRPQGGTRLVPGDTLEPANPRRLPEFQFPLSGLGATSVALRASLHTRATLSENDTDLLLLSVVPQSWSLRCPRWSLLAHLGRSLKPGSGGRGSPPPQPPRHRAPPTCTYPHRSSTQPKCAGTRSSGRRCPAKRLWTRGAWILRGDVNTCGFWFRLVPLCLDANLVPAPSLPCIPSSCFSFCSELSSTCGLSLSTGSPSRSPQDVAHSPSVQAPGQAVAGSSWWPS